MADKTPNIPENCHPALKEAWSNMPNQWKFIEQMKYDQAKRGKAGYEERMALRATRKTWRQMTGFKLFWHELTYKGNLPFVYGFAITSSVMMYIHYSNFNEEAKAESKYWQRFYAKKEGHH